MRFRAAWLASALLAAPLAAQAQPFHGVYVGAGAGYNLPENDPFASGGDTMPGGGFVGLGSVGYGLGNGFRFELEGNYRQAPLPAESGARVASSGGHLNTYGVMVNALYDLDIGLPWLYPYLGGGIGYAWSDFARHRTFTAASAPLVAQAIDSTEGGFAFQAIGGLSFPIPHMPGLTVSAEYRFFGIPGSETFNGTETFAGAPAPTPTPIHPRIEHQYNHSFLLGVRYAFAQVPPAPPAAAPSAAPAPAMQPARSYLVFFDWDKATLTDRARQIIKEAADNSTHVQVTRIEVNGYTDTSGTPQYNMGLSIRRANAVKAELIRDGVSAGEITTQGFGETHLLVPTGNGVREPQNRRVEIILH